MVNFVEQRLPDHIAYGMSGGPTFSTTVIESHVGREQRNVNWSKARWKWSFDGPLRDMSDYDDLRAFFTVVQGRYYGFRFKDPFDYQLTNEQIATGDGTTTTFRLKKTYTFGTETYSRRILKAVANSQTVKVNGVTKTEGVDYTFYPNTGYVVFAVAPTNTHPIVVSCEFDMPVRFDMDVLKLGFEGYAAQSAKGVEIVDVSLEIENSITGPA